jgi:hypothetical protein
MNLFDVNDEKFKTVEVQGYNFKIRWISPVDKISVAQRRMRLQGGQAVSSLTEDDFIFFENVAICDTCVEELPKEFKDNESCARWNDIDLINGVANKIREHTNDIESKLKKNKPVIGGE